MPGRKAKGVVRLQFKDPTTNLTKYLQTDLDRHPNKEAARQFLLEKKRKIIEAGKNKTPENIEDVDKDKDDKDPQMVQADNEGGECNLMNIPVESSQMLQDIYDNLTFSPFKLNLDIEDTGHSLTVVGSSKSGKTTLLKSLLDQYITNKKCICVMAAHNMHNKIYKNYHKDIIKTDQYSNILVKAGARINKRLGNKFPFVYVLDDIITMKNDKKLEDCYLTLRNSLVSIIVLIQNIQLLKSTSRSNSNIIIFKKFNNPKAIEDYVMKEYLANYPPFRDLAMKDKVNLYMKIMNDGNYNFFVLDVLENTLILCKGTDLKAK